MAVLSINILIALSLLWYLSSVFSRCLYAGYRARSRDGSLENGRPKTLRYCRIRGTVTALLGMTLAEYFWWSCCLRDISVTGLLDDTVANCFAHGIGIAIVGFVVTYVTGGALGITHPGNHEADDDMDDDPAPLNLFVGSEDGSPFLDDES